MRVLDDVIALNHLTTFQQVHLEYTHIYIKGKKMVLYIPMLILLIILQHLIQF